MAHLLISDDHAILYNEYDIIVYYNNFRTEEHHRIASERTEVADREQVRDAVSG